MADTVISRSPEQTEQVGARLAEICAGGRVLALTGDLGAGKTALVRGLARALGYQGRGDESHLCHCQRLPGGREDGAVSF